MAALKIIVDRTDPADRDSLQTAVGEFEEFQSAYRLKNTFFDDMRNKTKFKDRPTFVQNLLTLENVNIYWKLEALRNCRDEWGKSSAALDPIFSRAAVALVHCHIDDLLAHDRLSCNLLYEISELTDTKVPGLTIELIKKCASDDSVASGSVWLTFATMISGNSDKGLGQIALRRLLRSGTAKLADRVFDGAWRSDIYPTNDSEIVAVGIIWRVLGSPSAESRWRAAHSIRCLGRFKRWKLVDALVRNIDENGAGCFQASELPFYHMHAALWLLISLARMAIDFPKEIARYKKTLLRFSSIEENSHVLMRHFASQALLSCYGAGGLILGASRLAKLRLVNMSPHQSGRKPTTTRRAAYGRRPETTPEPEFKFGLDYEFQKYEVDSLAGVFGVSCWEVEDLISGITHEIDPSVSSMYETGERELPYRHNTHEMTSRFHSYGQQLGWHALLIAAGKLLESTPVHWREWNDYDPWLDWLKRYALTRSDGYWLSDGVDRMPIDTTTVLLETSKKGLVVTGDEEKILQLVGVSHGIGKELVVDGRWNSSDQIRVQVSSAMVPVDKATKYARGLIREDPMNVWLPKYNSYEDDGEFLRAEIKKFTPWIVQFDGEAKIDDHDPFGVGCADHRPCFATEFASALSITSDNPFNRVWKNKRDIVVLRAEAWGREDIYTEGGPYSGLRLLCSAKSLKQILKKYDKDLLLLINLQKYERGLSGRDSKYNNTVAVVRVSKTLEVQYFKGRVNHAWVPRY